MIQLIVYKQTIIESLLKRVLYKYNPIIQFYLRIMGKLLYKLKKLLLMLLNQYSLKVKYCLITNQQQRNMQMIIAVEELGLVIKYNQQILKSKYKLLMMVYNSQMILVLSISMIKHQMAIIIKDHYIARLQLINQNNLLIKDMQTKKSQIINTLLLRILLLTQQ